MIAISYTINFEPDNVVGLSKEDAAALSRLINVYRAHIYNNDRKQEYYEGKIPLSRVNLGIALPHGMRGLEIGCAWGAKTVDVLAAHSMFDGFVNLNGEEAEELNAIVADNRLVSEYSKAVKEELKFGCCFATLSADSKIKCKIRFHSPRNAAALWSGEKGRIDCGFAIIDTAPGTNEAKLVNLYTDTHIIVLRRTAYGYWTAEEHKHPMGRPLMEPLIWNATVDKPFGRSRIKEPIRRLIEGFVRTVANATIGLEFATAPQKYLLGVSDEQYDALINQKFRQYVGNIIAATSNPENGEKPTFGQLPQGSISPHVEMLRILSTQFSAATGLSVTDTGVINTANPTSSEAILAQTRTLVRMAEELNINNGESLRTIALMALAIANSTTIEKLAPEQKKIVAHFKNPATPSISATADAASKIATARASFAQTDVFLEMMGFDKADVRRIKAQEQRARGLALFEELNLNDNQ